ncbi:hypothetical protein [Shimia thalassica]|uniref:hypothetical protein n=1 Tax=Shimia thalassica TaxID=1715693 RepID=UPI0026E2873D|nr:hypothetical protein [Shimia thalassica]MDO6479129.1 hypothetical protein [Shimia thalassica]
MRELAVVAPLLVFAQVLCGLCKPVVNGVDVGGFGFEIDNDRLSVCVNFFGPAILQPRNNFVAYVVPIFAVCLTGDELSFAVSVKKAPPKSDHRDALLCEFFAQEYAGGGEWVFSIQNGACVFTRGLHAFFLPEFVFLVLEKLVYHLFNVGLFIAERFRF